MLQVPCLGPNHHAWVKQSKALLDEPPTTLHYLGSGTRHTGGGSRDHYPAVFFLFLHTCTSLLGDCPFSPTDVVWVTVLKEQLARTVHLIPTHSKTPLLIHCTNSSVMHFPTCLLFKVLYMIWLFTVTYIQQDDKILLCTVRKTLKHKT